MAPMVSTVHEAAAFADQVRAAGLPVAGMMVEVPAAALRAGRMMASSSTSLSIGTNDLTQYAMATDRMAGELAELLDPWQPAVLDLIAAPARPAGARQAGRRVRRGRRRSAARAGAGRARHHQPVDGRPGRCRLFGSPWPRVRERSARPWRASPSPPRTRWQGRDARWPTGHYDPIRGWNPTRWPNRQLARRAIKQTPGCLRSGHVRCATPPQSIRFCRAPDGVRIAYAVHGSGPRCWSRPAGSASCSTTGRAPSGSTSCVTSGASPPSSGTTSAATGSPTGRSTTTRWRLGSATSRPSRTTPGSTASR